jgi:GTP cyclohydrolase I
MDEDLVRRGVVDILTGLGVSLSDPNFAGTPGRLVRCYAEAFSGLRDTAAQVDAVLSATFPCTHTQMIVARGIETWGMCPHHLLPVHYDVTVGYVPDGVGAQVLGVSKLCRLVEVLARRPVLQEQIVNDVTAALMSIPGCIGAGCIAHGEHGCMRVRGVRQQNAVIVTSSLQGVLFDKPEARAEFMSLMR